MFANMPNFKFKKKKKHSLILATVLILLTIITLLWNIYFPNQKRRNPVCTVSREVVGEGVVWVVPASYGCNDTVWVYARVSRGWVLEGIVVGGRRVGNGSSFVVSGNVTVRAFFARMCRLRVVGEPFPGRVAVNGSVYDLPFEGWYRCGSRLVVAGVGKKPSENALDSRVVPLSEPVNVTLDSDETVRLRFGVAYRVRIENPPEGLPARVEYVLAGREKTVELGNGSVVEVWADDGSVLRIVSEAPERVGERTVLYLESVVEHYRVATPNGTAVEEESLRVEEGDETSTAEVRVTMPVNLSLSYVEGLWIPPDYRWTGRVVVNGTPANITVIPLEKNIGTGAVHFTGRFIALPNGTMVLDADPIADVYLKMPDWRKLVIKGWILQRETKGNLFQFFVQKAGYMPGVYSGVLKAYYRYRFEIVVERLDDRYREVKISARFTSGTDQCVTVLVGYDNGKPVYKTECPEFEEGGHGSLPFLKKGDIFVVLHNAVVAFTVYVYP